MNMQPELRRSQREQPRKNYNESQYSEDTFDEKIEAYKTASRPTAKNPLKDPIIAERLKDPITAQLVADKSPLGDFLLGINTTNREAALAENVGSNLHVNAQATDEDLAWALCDMEQQSHLNTVTSTPILSKGLPTNAVKATTDAQAAEKTSRITSAHVSGLLSLNPTPTVSKAVEAATEEPATAEIFMRAASSSSTESDFSTPSVPNSQTEAASGSVVTPNAPPAPSAPPDAEPAAASVSGRSKFDKMREKMKPNLLPARVAPPAPINQANPEATGDLDMPDAVGKEPMEEISTGGVLSGQVNQVFDL